MLQVECFLSILCIGPIFCGVIPSKPLPHTKKGPRKEAFFLDMPTDYISPVGE